MTADQFNELYPPGTPCRIRITRRDPWITTKTRSLAWTLGHGDVVVSVEGKTGGWGIQPEWFEITPTVTGTNEDGR